MSVNIQMVEQLNKKAQQLNANRQKLIGMKESAKAAYDKAVFAYKQKYGVDLDDTNLQQEYDAVSAQLQAEYEELNKLILSIESGEYKNVNKQGSVQSQPVSQQQMVVQSQLQSQGVVQPNTFVQSPVQPHVQPQVQPHVQPQVQPQVQQQAQPFGQQFGQPFGQPFGQQVVQPQTQTPTQQSFSDEDVSEQPFTPQGWGDPNKNFANILGNNTGIRFGE